MRPFRLLVIILVAVISAGCGTRSVPGRVFTIKTTSDECPMWSSESLSVWLLNDQQVYHLETDGWKPSFDTKFDKAEVRCIAGSDDNNLRVGGALRFDGRTWNTMFPAPNGEVLWGTGHPTPFFLLVASGIPYIDRGGGWIGPTTPFFGPFGQGRSPVLAGTSTSDIHAVTSGASLFHFDGKTWRSMESPVPADYLDVAAFSPSAVRSRLVSHLRLDSPFPARRDAAVHQ